jgi:hypothetical protein
MKLFVFFGVVLRSRDPLLSTRLSCISRHVRDIMTGVKQTFLVLAVLVVGCSRQPDAPTAKAEVDSEDNKALELYDVSLNLDTVTVGQKISFCFKARNAVSVEGFPGSFQRHGALDGDCLVHAPQVDTLYRIQATGSDGTKRAQTALVKVRK